MSMSIEEDLALAAGVVAAIEKAVFAYQAAKAGTISVSQALAHVQAMIDALPSEFAADDAAADAALDKKFKDARD